MCSMWTCGRSWNLTAAVRKQEQRRVLMVTEVTRGCRVIK